MKKYMIEGNKRWQFEILGFGYSDAFEYCQDIWLAFHCNIVLIDFKDLIDTMAWDFSINDIRCV